MKEVSERLASLRDAAISFRRADQLRTQLKKQLADAKDTRERAYSIYEAERDGLKELFDPLSCGPIADPLYQGEL